VIERAEKAGVSKMYLPAIDSSETDSMLALEQKLPGVCIAMMGLHPCYVKENVASELAHVRSWVDKRAFCGDRGNRIWTFIGIRLLLINNMKHLRLEMQWAAELNRPIVIHTRNAMQETINRVKPFAQKGLKGIFHRFSGSTESAKTNYRSGLFYWV
jgi:TatD DNase family protein